MGGQRRLVPKGLIEAFAKTFDKELYSDVEFVILSRKGGSKEPPVALSEQPPQDIEMRPPESAGLQSHQAGGDLSSRKDESTSPPPPLIGENLWASTSPTHAPLDGSTTQHALGEATPIESHSTRELPGVENKSSHAAPHRRTIWANKDILRRSEYFEAMLDSGFKEAKSNATADVTVS